MDEYRDHAQLKKRLKAAGYTVRTAAFAINMRPGLLANKLSGWAKMTSEDEENLAQLIRKSKEA